MATRNTGISWYHYILFLILPIIIGGKLLWDWFKNRSLSGDLLGMFSKNESKPELRKKREQYKNALEKAILKAAEKLKNKDIVASKNENKKNINAYKEETEEENEEIVSYKKESE